MLSSTRGQSETVGALLLVGIVTLSMSVYAVIYFDSITAGPDAPEVKVDGHTTGSGITLWHEAGQAVEESDLAVTVRVDGAEWTNVTWANGTVEGTADGRFSEGETWTWDDGTFAEGATVEVLLVHETTESVLYRSETTVGEG